MYQILVIPILEKHHQCPQSLPILPRFSSQQFLEKKNKSTVKSSPDSASEQIHGSSQIDRWNIPHMDLDGFGYIDVKQSLCMYI